MKYLKHLFLILFLIINNLYSQQLPLKIGNEWHYTYGLGPVVAPFIATVVDTVRINNILYYKIERWDTVAKKVTRITYDRIEGDSAYYRIYADTAKLIFNFNWQDGHIESNRYYDDTSCTELRKIKRDTTKIWGITTEEYLEIYGVYCPNNSPDTGWTLSGFYYLKNFGCYNAMDGYLIGAKINGITYGKLLPVPVELISFSEQIKSNSVLLKWSTATETNNYGFEILRNLLPSGNESKIGFVKGNGTITEIKNYELWDKNLKIGEYNYKLIQIDYDGTRKQIAETKVSIANPSYFMLYQNYPNPFNPTTKIEYNIPKESDITLLVYNILGEIIYKLKQSSVKAGKHEIIFDGKNLPSGIYCYQIRTTDFIDTKEMLLLK